jgi:hypothetical protein
MCFLLPPNYLVTKNKPLSTPGKSLRAQRRHSALCDELCALYGKRKIVLQWFLITISQQKIKRKPNVGRR